MNQKLYVIVATTPSGKNLLVNTPPAPLGDAIDCARYLNRTVYSVIPAGGMTEWWCREGQYRFRR